MSEAWKKIDLGGAGLQTLNARLTRQLKHAGVAYGLCALFPLGLHRFYLGERLGGFAYLALSLLGLALWFGLHSWLALLPLAAGTALLIFDLFWIDRYVVRYNKQLRMQQYLRPGARPPKDYKGRYSDETDLGDYLHEKERERVGHQPVDMEALEDEGPQKHIPSFAEQEAMLRELAKSNKGRKRE